jgi:hypothetical protein
MKQTRQAVHAVKQSIFLNVYEMIIQLWAGMKQVKKRVHVCMALCPKAE